MSVLPQGPWCRDEPVDLYRAVLSGYGPGVLRGIRDHLELDASIKSSAQLARTIEEHLRDPAHRTAALADLPRELRPALALLPYVPATGWSVEDLRGLLRYTGCRTPDRAIRALLGLGLLMLRGVPYRLDTPRAFDSALDDWEGELLQLIPHPSLAQDTARSPIDPPRSGVTHEAHGVRESDGRELLLRVAVLWQRIAESPLRLTQQSDLFKRDYERLQADPVLHSPLFDELVPIVDLSHLALILNRQLGLLHADADGELLRARLPALWQESMAAIQRRIWQILLGTRNWTEHGAGAAVLFEQRRLPARRWATLLLLAALEPESWVTLEELDKDLRSRDPDRDPEPNAHGRRPFQVVMGDDVASAPCPTELHESPTWIESFVLGWMYQVGVVQVAERAADGARVVRLSPLGRWVLGLADPPAPAPAFEKTLFVQPNHEVVVYRQGLTPELLGQLASFCRWKGLGGAVTLELTADSIYRGLELGRTVEEMIGILDRHSQRPIPPAVIDSMRTWSGRRERLRLYSRCTVLEFASHEDLEQAVARGVSGDRLNDRLLLIADEQSVPFELFRLTGSRDYRLPPSVCVEVEPDGITWQVDLSRSDLLVESELARFAEPLPVASNPAQLRYRLTTASLTHAARLGLRGPYLREWFRQRAGREIPASIELMLQAMSRSAVRLAQVLVIQTPTEAVADGLLQHPLTSPHIRSRIGPTTLEIAADHVEALHGALRELNVEIEP
jgi:hypothetical protein